MGGYIIDKEHLNFFGIFLHFNIEVGVDRSQKKVGIRVRRKISILVGVRVASDLSKDPDFLVRPSVKYL